MERFRGGRVGLVCARNVGRGDPDAVHFPLPPSGVLNYIGLSVPLRWGCSVSFTALTSPRPDARSSIDTRLPRTGSRLAQPSNANTYPLKP
jgi:hypothetical protein